MKLIQVNLRIVRVLNSCNLQMFYQLMDDLLSDQDYIKYFTKKRYLWGWLRPRDFYKSSAHYITELLKDRTPENMEKVDALITVIMQTTRDEKIKRSFVWNIMKNNPILSIDMIPYASSEKIRNILHSDKELIVDQVLTPFVDEITDLKEKINELKEEVQALQTIID